MTDLNYFLMINTTFYFIIIIIIIIIVIIIIILFIFLILQIYNDITIKLTKWKLI